MDAAADGRAARDFLATLGVGDLCGGTATEVTRSHGLVVTLDGFPARPLGTVGPLDVSWRPGVPAAVRAGQRITAEVIAVEPGEERVRLSMAATENPELWAFLKARRPGEILSGTVASLQRFGVFVALDEGPAHPVFPGVGFITIPQLSWHRVEEASDVVSTGQRVSCAFLQFDTWNGEARLSLRATRPDPFLAFADGLTVGQSLRGRVTRSLPAGVLVRIADGVEGLIRQARAVRPGEEIAVVVAGIDRERRRLVLSRHETAPDLP
ncbi:S1 RNA-binding domain-containing protein [Streptomyces sp. NPDC049881]|uniref:S1 RNA-binding domain-containing protein n=1 Tax=Streptomyces sp. NPDC049881 TaxID=3155778 RepID=UPI0034153BC3